MKNFKMIFPYTTEEGNYKMSDSDVICPVCKKNMDHVFNEKILDKHDISYFHCSYCDFLKSESPYWLDEAYQNPISKTDTGIIKRNMVMMASLAPILYFFDKDIDYLDFASGYGILCRMMRDIGFNFYAYDKYCKNIFSEEFLIDITNQQNQNTFGGVTAIEVLEHIENPLDLFDTLQKLIKSDGCILFTTVLYSGAIPRKDWWYYSFNTGQHISFYTLKTLKTIGDKFGFHLISNGKNVHMFTRKNVSSLLFRTLLSRMGLLFSAYALLRMKILK